MTWEDINLTERLYLALQWAIKAHDGQYDKGGSPYILHPLHVSYMVDTEDEKIVALLHDIVEDTNYTLEDIASWGFDDLVYPIDCITKKKYKETYEEYIGRVCKCPISIRVKIADMKHNSDLTRLKNITNKDIKMVEKYTKWLPILKYVADLDRKYFDER